MATKRIVEIFSAGCPVCKRSVDRVKEIACSSCEITVLDMNTPHVAARAERLGIESLPAVVINNELVDCCKGGFDEEALQAAGLGSPL